MRKVKTHFQQVPIAVVEKLLEKEHIAAGKKKEIVGGKVIVERPIKAEPYSVPTDAIVTVHPSPFRT